MGLLQKFKRPVGRPTKQRAFNLPSKSDKASTSSPILPPKSGEALAPPPSLSPKFCLVCKFECEDRRYEYCSECFKVVDEYFQSTHENGDKNEINRPINETIGQTSTVTYENNTRELINQESQTNYSRGPQLMAFEQNHMHYMGTSFTTNVWNSGSQTAMMNCCQNQNQMFRPINNTIGQAAFNPYPYQPFMQLLTSQDPISVMEMSNLANVMNKFSHAKPRIITFKVIKNNQNNNEIQIDQTSYKRDVEGHAKIPQEMIKRPVGRPRIFPLTMPTKCEEMEKRGRGRPRLIPKRGRGRPRIYPITEPEATQLENREGDEEQEGPPAKRARGRPRIHPIVVQQTMECSEEIV